MVFLWCVTCHFNLLDNNFDEEEKMKKIILFLVILLMVFLGGCNFSTSDKESTLTSQGTYTIKEMPDEAIVYIGIDTLKSSAEESKNENSVISDNVINGLQLIGISKVDISTLNFNIYWQNLSI